MKRSHSILTSLWLLLLLVLLSSAPFPASAQNEADADASGLTSTDDRSQEELRKAFIHLQEQLHQTQLTIDSNRIEAQKTAREQAAAITDKLAAIQAALQTEQARQQDEMQRSNRTLLWVAAAFGVAGMGAMAFTAVFQWRTMNRIAELVPARAQLFAGSSAGLLTAGEMPKAVELSNQRLMSVIERLEKRVLELEAAASLAAGSTEVEATPVSENGELSGDAARITVLLGKGQSMLNADQPERALECYDAILAMDQNHPEALVKKGAALERLKQDDEALRCYDRAIQADETLTIAYLYKGGVYNRLERYNEALECYEKALRVQGKQA
jgi:tetratricopeptide (TPR) repeat protein